MSKYAGDLPRRFISFHHLDSESSAHYLPEEREAEHPRNAAQTDEVNTFVVDGISSSPTKAMSILQGGPIEAEIVAAREGDEEIDLTIGEKHCALTSSVEDVENLGASATENMQCLSERSVEEIIGDQNVSVEEILRGNVGVEGGWS